MHKSIRSSVAARRASLLGALLLAGTAWPALAQDQTAPAAPAAGQDQTAAPAEDQSNEIVVSGYRASLQSSANAKRDAVGFTDSIFAEDIGKFPDTNIAESLNRVPGVNIIRDSTGEGLNVAIRGLGPNFTKVTLNGTPVAIASTGRTDSQNTNREVDLDMFPTELFTKLTVIKSPTAALIEGGAAGNVDLRSARPFDNPGMHLTYSGQLTKNNNSDDWGYRGSLLGSATFGNFGILAGVVGVRSQVRTTGFETIGWTNPNLSTPQSIAGTGNVPTPAQILAAQCRASSGCNGTGGGNWTIPGTVPANAGNGLTTGDQINQDFLLAHNPGATIQQIDNGLIPRLGRPSDEFGTKDRVNAIVSLEWRPMDTMRFYVDGMYGKKSNDLQRIDMNWVGRNGAAIPLNTKYDRSDCSAGCVVTEGTYANSQFFLEYRPFIEDTDYWGVNPGFEFEPAHNLKFNGQFNYTKSTFHRESPTVLVITPASSGITVNYKNDGDIPTITPVGVDLNNPAAFGWNGGRVNIQDEKRKTETMGFRGDLTWGDDHLNLQVGGSYDDVSRRISAYDNSQAWQNAVCGNAPSVFLPSPNSQPPCQGLNSPGAAPAGYPTYPAFGTGYTAGQTGPVTYGGSLIPQPALAGYLMPGPDGFITVDWDKFKQGSNYDFFHDNAPQAGSSNTGASGGYVREVSTAAYAEVNGNVPLGDGDLRFNAGIRYVTTDQTIGGLISLPDPRNNLPGGTCPLSNKSADGSCYPNITNFVYTRNSYDNWLPSASAAYSITHNAVVRASVSRTMTRPDPNAQLPGLNFSTPSADVGTLGNSALKPYLSTNFDLGFEYYTGKEGYIGFAAFRKAITGFTVPGTTTVPFSALAAFGVSYNTLTPTQQAAIDARGGPNNATVVLQQQVNAEGTLKVNGLEFTWVQPLDFVLDRYLGIKGFGFNANLTLIDQKGSGAAPAVALNVPGVTYNVTGYYENHGFSVRLSMVFYQGSQTSGANQNGIGSAALFSDDYQQWDLSSSLDLGEVFHNKHLPELTFDVVNLTEATQRSYFQFENAAFTAYNPGRTIMFGLRGKF